MSMALSLDARLEVARRALGRSVVAINPRAQEEAAEKIAGFISVGIKDTATIPMTLLDMVRGAPRCLVLTVDRMSDMGRSVDTELTNPLTYRPMTGSTSGGAINVLKGINDACVGTDGGGSILAPAAAASLYSFMGKGLGLIADGGISTDGINYTSGIGFIGNSLSCVMLLAEIVTGEHLGDGAPGGKVVVPEEGCATLPDGTDMHNRLEPWVNQLDEAWDVVPWRFSNIYERIDAVNDLRHIERKLPGACVLTLEGPIDLLGPDETIPRCFGRHTAGLIARYRSKALVKAVNMAGWSGVGIPTDELASGLLVSCGPGVGPIRRALALAKELDALTELPDLLVRYFLNRTKEPCPIGLFQSCG